MTPGATGHGPGTVSWRIGRGTSIVEELTPDLFVVGSRSMVGPGTGGSENRIELVGRGLGAETVEQVAPFGPGRSWVCAQAHHDPRSHWARPRHGVLEDRSAGTGVILRFRRCRGLFDGLSGGPLGGRAVGASWREDCA